MLLKPLLSASESHPIKWGDSTPLPGAVRGRVKQGMVWVCWCQWLWKCTEYVSDGWQWFRNPLGVGKALVSLLVPRSLSNSLTDICGLLRWYSSFPGTCAGGSTERGWSSSAVLLRSDTTAFSCAAHVVCRARDGESHVPPYS